MKILFLGDVVGLSGCRKISKDLLGQIQKNNIDYKAKRKNNNPLGFPRVTIVEKGSFFKWMKKRGKLGGQHKVPRIDGSKIFINEIIKISNTIC